MALHEFEYDGDLNGVKLLPMALDTEDAVWFVLTMRELRDNNEHVPARVMVMADRLADQLGEYL